MGADLVCRGRPVCLPSRTGDHAGSPLPIHNQEPKPRGRVIRTIKNAKLRAGLFAIAFLLLFLPARVLAFCHELEVVQGKIYRVAATPAAPLTLEWMGHST